MGCLALSLSALLCAYPARAADGMERELVAERDAEGPPPMPSLSHQGLALDFEYAIVRATATDVVTGEPLEGPGAYGYAAALAASFALVPRRFYVGVAEDFASASVPSGISRESGGSSVVAGNPELWARALWTSRVGLAAGGGLGAVLPLPRSFTATETEVVRVVRVMRPWGEPHFQDLTMTLRPFLDIRHMVGPVLLEARQGIDLGVRVRDLRGHESRTEIGAQTSLFVGLRLHRTVMAGLELHEVYQLTADVSSPSCPAPCDEHRVELSIAPSLRFRWRPIAPSLSLLLPLSTPLRAEVDSYYAARLHVGANLALD